jgi:S-adenosyl methyltransferase
VDADLRDPTRIFGQAKCTLDPSQPVAVFLLAALHLIPDADDPAGLVTALAADLAPGSCLAITHLTADFAPRPVTAAVQAYNAAAPYQ